MEGGKCGFSTQKEKNCHVLNGQKGYVFYKDRSTILYFRRYKTHIR